MFTNKFNQCTQIYFDTVSNLISNKNRSLEAIPPIIMEGTFHYQTQFINKSSVGLPKIMTRSAFSKRGVFYLVPLCEVSLSVLCLLLCKMYDVLAYRSADGWTQLCFVIFFRFWLKAFGGISALNILLNSFENAFVVN